MENERQKQTAMSMLAGELPRSDQAKLSSNAEYEKLDGFHDKPRGSDQILTQMRQEEKEIQDAKAGGDQGRVAEELQAIENKKRM